VGFVQVVAQLVQLETLRAIGTYPLIDPRAVQRRLARFTDHLPAALPLRGVGLPHMNLRAALREAIASLDRNPPS
jgi:hypothetical protein